jgi:Ca2+-binding RTX toxin-like protein
MACRLIAAGTPVMHNHLVHALESRTLFAAVPAAVTAVIVDGALVINGTRGADSIGVVAHFPGTEIFDLFVNGAFTQQLGGSAIRVVGHGGDDTLSVTGGILVPVTLLGGPGNDTLTSANARVFGTGAVNGPDLLDGGPGNDTLTAFDGDDTLLGRGGNDSLNAGPGNDRIDGGPGRDTLLGSDGDDVLFGGRGIDTLLGSDGDDTLTGNAATDILTGGAGADVFSKRDRTIEISDLTAEDTRG